MQCLYRVLAGAPFEQHWGGANFLGGEGLTLWFQNLDGETKWIGFFDGRDVDVQILRCQCRGIIGLSLDLFTGELRPDLPYQLKSLLTMRTKRTAYILLCCLCRFFSGGELLAE